jgi:DNA repair exonuclease SbcCD ATPase subunit
MDLTKLKNPFIRVVWEDVTENFSKERMKRVKSYFSRKYNSKNITIVTRTQKVKGENLEVDLDLDIMSKDSQRKLMKDFLENEGVGVKIPNIYKLDDKVNEKLELSGKYQTRYKTIKVKKIKFSNFLSFGDNNELNFSKINGITVIDSNPPNFGGKTVLAVDLLLFLFFNNTTKTTKAIEIFNKFTNKNEVIVQGEIEIDGTDYIIVRKIQRKLTKKGDWSVKTTLEFFERLSDGSLNNFTGEQRRETEKFIKESIGNMDDFLLTILNTGSNLESLIDSKPTERGNIFYRFVGLETLKEKEKICKEMHNTWSRSLVSNLYDIETLKYENTQQKENIKELEVSIEEVENAVKIKNTDIKITTHQKDELLASKYSDIGDSVGRINIKFLESSLEESIKQLKQKEVEIVEIEVKEPETYFNPIEYNKKEIEKNVISKKVTILETEVNKDGKTIEELENSQFCPTCGKSLEDVDHSEDIGNKKEELLKTKDKLSKKIAIESKIGDELGELHLLKLQLEIYDKNKLIKEKKTLEADAINMSVEKQKNSIESYNLNKKKIEYNKKVESDKIRLDLKLSELERGRDRLYDNKNSQQLQLDRAKRDVRANSENIEKIKKEDQIRKIFESYLLTFGKNGISKIILKSLIPTINNEINRLLAANVHFSLEVVINEKNELDFIMIEKDSQIRKNLSSGSGFEKTISSLTLRAVLTRFSSLPKPNVTVFDEVFGKVSNENLDLIGEFFFKLKDYFENILLITHNPLVTEWGDRLITVKKVDNISTL